MKTHISLSLIFISLLLASAPARAQDGFTNIAEAKNELIAGVKEGKWVEYFDNYWKPTTDTAAIDNYLLTDYRAGKPFGMTRRYDKSGDLIYETPYTDGKENGILKGYYKGKLSSETSYIDGKIIGIQKGYYNGKLSSEAPYTDGKKNGMMKFYSETGKLEREIPYTNDKANGMERGYFKNGVISVETPFKDDLENGVSKDYYESGELRGEIPYTDGKKNGIRKEYYHGGKIKWEDPYINGKETGLEKQYYESGKLKYEIPYFNDTINGMKRCYNENGSLNYETPYTNGKENPKTLDIFNNYILNLNNTISTQDNLFNHEDNYRKIIIAMADTMTPPPAIPEDANRHLVMGKTAAKMATDASGYADAIAEFKSAVLAAPWLGIAYFDLAVVQESAHDYKSAMENFNYYLLAAPNAPDASDVKTRIYELEYKAKKKGEQDQIAAVDETKKRQTRRVLDQLMAITGNTEYWWFFASIGDIAKGGRSGLNMSEFESGGKHWWDFGIWRSRYIFKDDKVYICTYNDLNPDKASLIGTPNGPGIADISWEATTYDASGHLLSKKTTWAHINESNGDIFFSGNRPLTNPDRNAFYNYWWYSRK